jgi:ATP-binding cassette, subfamily B, bacterial CvaB/MchF/RaxB
MDIRASLLYLWTLGKMTLFNALNLDFKKKLPVILQTEASECGLASLAMVACFHGFVTDLATLRSRHSISLKGATLAELMRIASSLGFQSRPMRLELEEIRELNTPCILHWDLNHFVVLAKVTSELIVIHDPAQGIKRVKYEEVSRRFTGVALELLPSINFVKEKQQQRIQLRTLFGKVIGIRSSLFQVFLLAAALEVFGVVAPFFSQLIIDDVLVAGDEDLLKVLAIGILLVAIIKISIDLARSWVVMHFSTTLLIEWSSNVVGHLFRLPVSWFEKRHLGDIVSRFGSLGAIQGAMTGGLVGAVLDGIMAVITLIMMFIYSPILSAIAISAVCFYALVRIVRYSTLRDSSAEQLVRSAKLQSHFLESVRGIQALKLFNRTGDRRQRYIKIAVDATNTGLAIQKQNMVFKTTNGFLVAIENAAILFVGAKLVLGGQFSVGMLIAFISYKDQFISRISGLIDTCISFKMLGIQTERLSDIVLTKPEDLDNVLYMSTSPLDASMELRNVSFRYAPGDPWVLQGISMKIEAGECVAIAGPSGCGKTTLLKIMLGQLHPEEGEILVGGIPLKQLGLSYYRDKIGVVMQDDELFSGSLSENISFFDPQPNQAQVESCAKHAFIHNDICRMAMGYNSLIGEMGAALSGGQKQRVILARALYKNPQLLFLDEATSHLDEHSERAVNMSLKKLCATRITIAHRQQTLEMADRIIDLTNRNVHSLNSHHLHTAIVN